jgi:phosphoglycolate phosphatase
LSATGLLIFDLDGTLFRTESVTVPAIQTSFAAYGLPAPPHETILPLIGTPMDDLRSWVHERCPEQRADDLFAEIESRELGLIATDGLLYAGVRGMLTELRSAGYQITLCTNGPTEYVRRVVESQDLDVFLDTSRNRISASDTKPAMVRSILAELDGRPAVVIGDRLGDVEAAHYNGLRSIAASYGYGTSEELAASDRVAQSPHDIPGLIAELAEST